MKKKSNIRIKIEQEHGYCIKKIYDIDLWSVVIKRGKSKKTAKIFFLLIFFSQKKFAKNGLMGTQFFSH
jgi:hypothetical protein